MNQFDAQIFVSLARFVLDVGEMQIATTKFFLTRFDGLAASQKLRDQMASLPDSEELRQLREQRDVAERELAARNAPLMSHLRDVLARLETDQEKIGAGVAALRASLPPGPA